MGVTIHYQGKINDKKTIYKLIEEVEDIAQTESWPYQVLDEDWAVPPTAKLESTSGLAGIQIIGHTGLKGIRFQPHPECEYIWLFFNHAGLLTTPFRIALDAEENYPERKPWLSTKTGFSSMATHIKVINLFQYLKEKYISDLDLQDESGFWESKNRNHLEKFYLSEKPIEGGQQTVDKSF